MGRAWRSVSCELCGLIDPSTYACVVMCTSVHVIVLLYIQPMWLVCVGWGHFHVCCVWAIAQVCSYMSQYLFSTPKLVAVMTVIVGWLSCGCGGACMYVCVCMPGIYYNFKDLVAQGI